MAILDRKCTTPGCWHYRERGVIYCIHCLRGSCESFTPEQKATYRKEVEERNKLEGLASGQGGSSTLAKARKTCPSCGETTELENFGPTGECYTCAVLTEDAMWGSS